MSLIRLDKVSKFYNNVSGIAKGIDNISLELNLGEFVAITGSSGSGKTTLLNILGAIDKLDNGSYFFNEADISSFTVPELEDFRKENISFIFQEYNLIESMSVLDNVMIPLIFNKMEKRRALKKAKEIIAQVGLTKYIKHKATQLSGGQQQRVVIARALAKDSKIIVCDEPTGNLDKEQGLNIIKLLKEISKDKLVLIVTHNPDELLEYKTRELKISDGRLIDDIKYSKTSSDDTTFLEKVNVEKIPTTPLKEKKINKLSLIFRYFFSQPKKSILMFLVFFVFGLNLLAAITFITGNLLFENFTKVKNSHFQIADKNRGVIFKSNNEVFNVDEIVKIKEKLKHAEYIENSHFMDNSFKKRIHSDPIAFIPLSYAKNFKISYGRFPKDESEVAVIEDNHRFYHRINESAHLPRYTENTPDVNVVGLIETNLNDIKINSKYIYVVVDSFFERNLPYFVFSQNAFIHGEKSLTFSFPDVSGLEGYNLPFAHFSTKVDKDIEDDVLYINSETSEPDKEFILTKDSVILSYLKKEYNYIDNLKVIIKQKGTYNFSIRQSDTCKFALNEKTMMKFLKTTLDIKKELSFRFDKPNYQKIQSSLKELSKDLDYQYIIVNSDKSSSLFVEVDGILYLIKTFLIIFIFIGFLIYKLITDVLFKQIFKTKQKDYNIFRTLGANKKDINKFVFIENLIMMNISFIVFVVFGLICKFALFKVPFFRVFAHLNALTLFIFYFALLYISISASIRYLESIYRKNIATTLSKGGSKR